jgi:hypothetical protein
VYKQLFSGAVNQRPRACVLRRPSGLDAYQAIASSPFAAGAIPNLVDVHFADVEQLVLVMDQLNIHAPGSSLYEAFPPAQAKRLASKLEIHHILECGMAVGSTWPRPS